MHYIRSRVGACVRGLWKSGMPLVPAVRLPAVGEKDQRDDAGRGRDRAEKMDQRQGEAARPARCHCFELATQSTQPASLTGRRPRGVSCGAAVLYVPVYYGHSRCHVRAWSS
jgi:hypothetical protein